MKPRIGESGRRSEKRLARELGGKQRPASGAVAGAKGDIDLGTVLLEAKSTCADRLQLKREWLAKIAQEARAEGKIPACAIDFTYGDGRPVMDGSWVLIPRWWWRELCQSQP